MSLRYTSWQSVQNMPVNNSILIVEDDREPLDVLTRRFIQAGYRVVAVHHPRQAPRRPALDRFRSHCLTPDCRKLTDWT